MFTIELYKNSAENIIVDKVDYMRKEFEIEGVLREETSLINPVITIEINPTKVIYVRDSENKFVVDNDIVRVITELTKGVLNCNYCHIPLFDRYYYIDDIVSIRNNLWSISMTCDVLMSFKNKIYDLDVFCLRQEFEYNELLPDNMMPSNNKKILDIVSGTNVGLINPIDIFSSDETVILQTMGKHDNDGLFYSGNVSASNNIYLLSDVMVNKAINEIMNWSELVNGSVTRLVDSNQCIRKVSVFPFNIYQYYINNKIQGYHYEYSRKINVSFTSINFNEDFLSLYLSDCTPITLDGGYVDINTKYNNFLDYEPYTEVLIYVPFTGYVSIPTDYVMGKRVYIEYIIDVTQTTGLSIVYIIDNDRKIVLQINESEIAVDIPIDQAGVHDLKKSIFTGLTKLITGVALAPITGGLSLMGASDALSANYKAYANAEKTPASHMSFVRHRENIKAQTIGGMVKSSFNAVSDYTIDLLNAMKSNVRVSDNGSMGASLMSTYGIIPIANITRPNPVYYNENEDYSLKYNHLIGRPSSYNGRLGNLKGYTKVSGVHITNMENALSEEKDAIESMLKSGVIL